MHVPHTELKRFYEVKTKYLIALKRLYVTVRCLDLDNRTCLISVTYSVITFHLSRPYSCIRQYLYTSDGVDYNIYLFKSRKSISHEQLIH